MTLRPDGLYGPQTLIVQLFKKHGQKQKSFLHSGSKFLISACL